MGRRCVTIPRDPRCFWLLTFPLLVLREIEQEDTLWHQKQKSTQESKQQTAKDEKQPTQKSEGKDAVVPATASAGDETMKKTQSTRKLNFF